MLRTILNYFCLWCIRDTSKGNVCGNKSRSKRIAVALLVRRRTCHLQVAFRVLLGLRCVVSGLGQATYTCVPLLPTSIIWYRPKGDFLGWESSRWRGVKNGFMTNATCGLTAKKPGPVSCPTFVIEYGTAFYCLASVAYFVKKSLLALCDSKNSLSLY